MKIKRRPEKKSKIGSQTFADLYETNLPRVYRYIYYRVRDVTLAEDLTAAVFEKAFTKLDRYSADKASFFTWLAAIARNTIVDYFRKAGRETAVLPNPSSEVNSAVDEIIKKEDRERLLLYVSELTETEQEIISLKFGSGLTNREIAKLHHLLESNVGTIVYRAIQKIRAKFGEDENE